MTLFLEQGLQREAMECTLRRLHYTKSVPSGKSWYFSFEDAIIVFSIPPNPYVSKWLVGEPKKVLELSRLWAPDGHEPNLLSAAVSAAVGRITLLERPEALISYADPNVGHEGFVYRACSWTPLGQSEESRYYIDASGNTVARRSFHSGRRSMTKAEIEATGYIEQKRPGKLRFAKGVTRRGKAAVMRKAQELNTSE